jgi:hypothetical protein
MPIADKRNQAGGGGGMWPSESWASTLYNAANIGLIAGLVVGAISTIMLVWMGNVKETYLRTSLAKTNRQAAQLQLDVAHIQGENLKLSNDLAGKDAEIATARKEAAAAQSTAEGFRFAIAKANDDASEANKIAEQEHLARVRIEEKLAGWKLDAGAQQRIISKIKKYEKTPFDLGTTPNELTFMETIDSILLGAGWIRQTPSSDNPLFNLLLNGKARINYVSGIYIEIAASKAAELQPAAEALARALMDEGIPIKTQKALHEPDENAVHVVIGSK